MNPIFKTFNFPWRLLGFGLLVTLMLFLAVNMADGQTVDHERFLCSVVTVEATPGRGSNGELGKYQFTAQTWRQHSKQPHEWALGRTSEARMERDRVARAHTKWIEQHLENPTVYRMALVWNAGLNTVKRNAFTDASVDYANRVRNVYGEGGQ